MPSNGPIFQDHHDIEQQTFRNSRLLKMLSDSGLYGIHAQENRLFLPSDPLFADTIRISPHSGGPIADYQIGIRAQLQDLEQTADGRAAIAGDPEALDRITNRVELLRDTMKVGLVNGDLHTNAPFGMTADDIRPSVQFFFSNVDSYGVKHAQQIDAFKFMPQSELGWVAITHSESRLIATLDYADQTGRNLIRGGDPELGRQSLSQAITSAHAGGRLTLSEHGIARFENTFGTEAARPLRIPPGQSGFISPQLLTGDLSVGHTLRAAGIVASAVDALNTAERVKTLLQQDNLIGAKHELRDYAATNTNAWLAAYAFGKLGAEMSVARGGRHVGAVAGAIAGGIIGYTMSDKAMAAVDAKEIRIQTDARNIVWNHNGTEWVRNIPVEATVPIDRLRRLRTDRSVYARSREPLACSRSG